VSRKEKYVYLVQNVSSETKFSSFSKNYFSELSVSVEQLDNFVKTNKFTVSICLALFIVGSFLLKGF